MKGNVIKITFKQSISYYICYEKKIIMPTIQLTTEQFKTDVFDYTTEKEWKFKGSIPAIIDFYADWCGPCKAVAPILEELSNDYTGKVLIYKVDTEVEQELSAVFQIRSIPSMLFIPVDKQPMMQAGALPKAALKEVIETELLTAAN
jgi:thioredoxin